MEIKRVFEGIYRRLWLVILLAVVGGGIGTYLNMNNDIKEYKAVSTLYILNRDKIQLAGQSLSTGDLEFSHQLVQDFSEIIGSQMVTDEVVRRLKLGSITASYVRSAVSISVPDGSNIITLQSLSTDPNIAQLIANTTSKVFVDMMSELTNSNNISVLDQAQLPQAPISNSSSAKIWLGILIGIVLAAVVIYIRESLDTTIRSIEDIEKNSALHVIGIIPVRSIK